MIRNTNSLFLSGCLIALVVQPATGALVTTRTDVDQSVGATVDGTIGGSEYNGYSYTGGGSGFGGTLGSGTLYFESDANDLFVGINIAGDLGGNMIAVFLDSRSGGFSDDSLISDVGDAGRNLATNLTRDVQDNFPVQADFVLEFGNGFTNAFELKTGALNFIAPTSSGTGGNGTAGDREASIPLSTLGLAPGDSVDFFAVLISDSNFSSDEGIAAPGFTGNPGFGSSTVTWGNHHQFNVAAVPEVTAALALPLLLGSVFGIRSFRRRRTA